MDKMIKAIEKLGDLYWGDLDKQSKRNYSEQLVVGWKIPLAHFLRHYAFERLGHSPSYPEVAAEVVKNYQEEKPQDDFEKTLWERFLDGIDLKPDNIKGANVKNNPMAPPDEKNEKKKMTITKLIHTIPGQFDYHLLKWIKSMLEKGNLEEPYNNLLKVSGIGPKIGAFYLRDITYAFDLEKKFDKKHAKYIQPIDLWTRRGAMIWTGNQNKLDAEYAEIIYQMCENAGVSPALANTGLWILGAVICKSKFKFEKALDGIDELTMALKENIARTRDELNAQKELLKQLQEI